MMFGVIISHIALNYHLRKFISGFGSMCRCCSGQEETTLHLLCVCPAHENQRKWWLGNAFPSYESI